MPDPVATRDLTHERELALAHAVALHEGRVLAGDEAGKLVRLTAADLFDWLIGPASLQIIIGPVRDADGQPLSDTNERNPVQLRITDQQGRPYEVDFTVIVRDAVGNVITDDPGTTTDDITWSLDSGEGVIGTTISGDTRMLTGTAAAIGSSVVRVSLGELTGTVAVDVIPGDAAELVISEGTPRPRPETEPEPV